jgi:hypothetical protein
VHPFNDHPPASSGLDFDAINYNNQVNSGEYGNESTSNWQFHTGFYTVADCHVEEQSEEHSKVIFADG